MSQLDVAILAGGMATRLGALTRETPKCLLDVGGRPFILHQLERLCEQNVRRVVLCVGHLGEQVLMAVGDGSTHGLEVVYSFDGPEPRGTAGAIKQALPLLGDRFFVLYGDSHLECDYAAVRDAHQREGKLALMTVFHNESGGDACNVQFEQRHILAYDKVRRTHKMHHIDYGLGVFDRRAFADVPESGPYDLATVYQQMLERRQLAGFEVAERYYEIGSVTGLEETRKHLAGRH